MEQATAIVHDDFYRVLRRRLRAWLHSKGKGFAYADMLLLAPDLLHLVCRLAIDARIASGDKARLASVIAYFVSLFDLMPEGLLGPVGYLDDIALAALVLHKIIGAGQEQVAREYWAGDEDLLQVLQRVLELSNKAIGSGLWGRLRRIV
jgi:uncharacterized membrane protein YkvA (DUF1232 family)